MFCYCLNNPVNMVDSDGTDAVVLYDESACTHIGALIQDSNGDWWHFYWGTQKKDRTVGLLFFGVPSYSWIKRYMGKIDLSSINALNQYGGTYDSMYYMIGDFSDSLREINSYTAEYALFLNNCSQVTCRILAKSNTQYKGTLLKASKHLLPSIANIIIHEFIYSGSGGGFHSYNSVLMEVM